MSEVRRVAVLVGSLRKASFSRRIANALAEVAPPSLALEQIDIGALPLYNEDLEATLPEAWRHFRERIPPFDALLFVTPEYNRSMPGALKNAIDVGSRPKAANVWNGKPAAIVSVTTGALGAFGANHHLRQALVFVNVIAMAQPEAYLANVAKLLDAEGKLADESTRGFLAKFMAAFAVWIEKQGVR